MAFASEKIYSFIKDYEKFKDKLYNDAVGYATIGYGHLVHFGNVGTNASKEKEFKNGITQEQALKLLRDDVRTKAEFYVNRYVTAKLSQNQFDALVSLTYNIGGANFANSTLLRKINEGETDPVKIIEYFKLWNKGKVNGVRTELKGLTHRRKQEADIYTKNIYVSIH